MGIAKVYNGGSVIVRTGTLAGVGPIGPQGQKGDPGPAGPVGPEGPTGPGGAVIEQIAIAEVAGAQSVGPGATISVAQSAVLTDDGGWWTSSTNLEFAEAQAFHYDAFVVFDKPANDGDGLRELYLLEDGSSDVIIAHAQIPAVALDDTVVHVCGSFIADTDAVYVLKARSTDDLSVAITGGRIVVNRIGAGPAGPQGPQGETGPVGPIGPQGEEGPDGDASSGFDTFDDL